MRRPTWYHYCIVVVSVLVGEGMTLIDIRDNTKHFATAFLYPASKISTTTRRRQYQRDDEIGIRLEQHQPQPRNDNHHYARFDGTSSSDDDGNRQSATKKYIDNDERKTKEISNENSIDDNKRRSVFQIMMSALITSGVSTIGGHTNPAFAAVVDKSSNQFLIPNPPYTNDVSWPLGKVAFSLLPLAGTSTRRATIEEVIVPDTMFTHDQIQGIVNVNVPVRQTVVVLKQGGLLVYNPVAPTPQLLRMMDRLISQYGPVKHILLGTVALEHKATFGPFASYYPNAVCWIQPGQWSFPLPIPIEFSGVVQRGPRLREIPIPGKPVTRKEYEYQAKVNPIPEWISEFDYEVLGPFQFKSVGGYSETVLYHKATKTLLVTDCVVSVTKDPPAIIQEDPRAMLYHSRDNALDPVIDTVETRQKGWRRMVQFGLVFFPSQIQVDTISEAITDATKIPTELQNLGQDAIPGSKLYPWRWNPNNVDAINFDTISQNGTLFCPPILTKLILDREPTATLEFVDRVVERFPDMQRIVPCHLNNNVMLRNGPMEFYNAFVPLRSTYPNNLRSQRPLAEDLALLQKASDLLTRMGVVAPSQICDGEPARQVGRFAMP